MVLVIKIAENIEHNIPILKVVAKPLMGPEPINDKTNAVNNVVTLASKIVINALLYPLLIAVLTLEPMRISSLIRSKIIMFASTDMPTVNNKPAIPGKVNTAFIDINIPKTKIIFINKARFANNPEIL